MGLPNGLKCAEDASLKNMPRAAASCSARKGTESKDGAQQQEKKSRENIKTCTNTWRSGQLRSHAGQADLTHSEW